LLDDRREHSQRLVGAAALEASLRLFVDGERLEPLGPARLAEALRALRRPDAPRPRSAGALLRALEEGERRLVERVGARRVGRPRREALARGARQLLDLEVLGLDGARLVLRIRFEHQKTRDAVREREALAESDRDLIGVAVL